MKVIEACGCEADIEVEADTIETVVELLKDFRDNHKHAKAYLPPMPALTVGGFSYRSGGVASAGTHTS